VEVRVLMEIEGEGIEINFGPEEDGRYLTHHY
jgi:hypothetical protein